MHSSTEPTNGALNIAKNDTPKIALRGTERSLTFGLVNVTVKTGPALDESARIAGRKADPDGLGRVKQQYVNEAGDVVKPVTAYDHGTTAVLADGLVDKLDDEGIRLIANTDPIAPEQVEATALCWPADDTQRDAYNLVSHYLASFGRTFIGTFAERGTTKVCAIRYSEVYGCLVFHTLAYHAQVRWANIAKITENTALAPVDERMAGMAKGIFESLDAEFDYTTVKDAYGERLAEAIAAAAEGREVDATDDTPAAPSPSSLMAQLEASLKAVPA